METIPYFYKYFAEEDRAGKLRITTERRGGPAFLSSFHVAFIIFVALNRKHHVLESLVTCILGEA